MSANSASSNDPTREPSVGVVGSGPLARRLIAVLKRDGLDAGAAVSARRARTPDVLVVAVESLASDKSDIHQTRSESSAAKLVVVVRAATPAEARQLLVDDVSGLVLEEHVEAILPLAVRSAVAGQISYPSELMPTHLKAALSIREKQILGMVVMGFSNAEIAAKLHVSESTVKSHLYSAFATLGVGSRKEAVALILDPNAGFGTGILAITEPSTR
jgi:DNA-binding NarL/FixJ family response regulator